MNSSLFYNPLTIFLILVLFICFSMLLCVLFTTLQPREYATSFHTFLQPDGTSVILKVYGDQFCIKAETLEGTLVVRDTRTDWICYAVLNVEHSSFISSGIPYIPGITFQQAKKESIRQDTFTADSHIFSLLPLSVTN